MNEKPVSPSHWILSFFVVAGGIACWIMGGRLLRQPHAVPINAESERAQDRVYAPLEEAARERRKQQPASAGPRDVPATFTDEGELELFHATFDEMLAPRGADELMEDDASTAPTAEGLYQRTAEKWTDPAFIRHAASIGLVFDPPTLTDCALALDYSAHLRDILGRVCEWDSLLAAIDFSSLADTIEGASVRALVFQHLELEEQNLMETLDECSLYKDWARVHRAWHAWFWNLGGE